jgi:predicted NACHT family NTPase
LEKSKNSPSWRSRIWQKHVYEIFHARFIRAARYQFLSSCVNSTKISNEDFTTFILSIAVNSQEQQAKRLFKAAVEEGQFVFIFDGYDEIEPKTRQAAEAAILKLGEHKNIVIVSSRPDEIFNSWQAFICYDMMPFSLEKTLCLIERLDFDIAVKNKFLERLRSDLFEKHKSFVSRPLLATMMLLTFSSYAESGGENPCIL